MTGRALAATAALVVAAGSITTALADAVTPAAQSPPPGSSKPTFAVVSIRPSTSDRQAGPYFMPGGRFRASAVSLKLLARMAYSYGRSGPLMNYEFDDAPSWIDTERFDIDATVDSGGASDPVALLRLQALLEDRFSLRLRTETRVRPVYDLVVSADAPRRERQLRPSTLHCPPPGGPPAPAGQSCGIEMGQGQMRGRGVELPYVALVLSATGSIDRRVRDRTGLRGQFDLDLRWAPDPFEVRGDGAAAASADPSIFTALEEQLGLKLEASSAPMEVFVIESAERPTAN
jgi:uncharacterized protein (TIGR03435 family)